MNVPQGQGRRIHCSVAPPYQAGLQGLQGILVRRQGYQLHGAPVNEPLETLPALLEALGIGLALLPVAGVESLFPVAVGDAVVALLADGRLSLTVSGISEQGLHPTHDAERD